MVDDSEVGPGIDFRKFLWKFDGLGDRPFPEISLEIWGLGGKFGGWECGGVKFTEPTGRNDMKIAFLRHFLMYFYLQKWVATKIWINPEEFRILLLLFIRIFSLRGRLCDKKK